MMSHVVWGMKGKMIKNYVFLQSKYTIHLAILKNLYQCDFCRFRYFMLRNGLRCFQRGPLN